MYIYVGAYGSTVCVVNLLPWYVNVFLPVISHVMVSGHVRFSYCQGDLHFRGAGRIEFLLLLVLDCSTNSSSGSGSRSGSGKQ